MNRGALSKASARPRRLLAPTERRGVGGICAALLVVLAACSTPPGAPPPAAEPAARPEPRSAEQPAPRRSPSAVDQFEQNHRTAADLAARKGRWSEATWAWDVVLAIKPDDAEALSGRRKAEAAAQAAVAERLPRAAQARSRGDLEQATRLYLEVLALRPGQTEAADALRAMEVDRSRRQAVAPFARAMVPGAATAPRTAAARQKTGSGIDLEHASLLAGQGEIDAAIALLQGANGTRRTDPQARAMLADLYVKQADKLAANDRAAAINALRQSLLAVPGHPAATLKLRQLQAAGATGKVGTPPAASTKPTALSRPSPGPSSGR